MIFRLLFGIVKGLLVGGLLGFGLTQIPGFASSLPAWIAYVAAPVVGIIVGLIAGKPIWAEGGKIEAGLKAGAGALLGALLMWGVRSLLGGVNLSALGVQGASLGTYAITSLAIVASTLGAFYDADNTPEPADAKKDAAASPKQLRVAAPKAAEFEDEEDFDTTEKKAKR